MLVDNCFGKFRIYSNSNKIKFYVRNKQLNQKIHDIRNKGKKTGETLQTTSPESCRVNNRNQDS